MRLLLVEDDRDFGAALRDALEQLGHSVHWLNAGRELRAVLLAQRFDAVLLDLGLPDVDGQSLLREMRQRRDATPLIVISARGERADRIDMLDLGADDYLVKPIDIGELAARLRAVTRRGRPGEAPGLEHGALRLDPTQGTVTWCGRRVALRERERWLLEQFMRHPAHIFSRTQLETALYGTDAGAGVDSNAIEVYVHHLRRKLAPDIIVTVRGLGYRLGPVHPPG